ncbi:ethanolamine utilization protein EutN [Salmonella enterica subsp. enterica]|nr:ethanolamine utilization protein EutN [Salmonella enterica subsp. enterica]
MIGKKLLLVRRVSADGNSPHRPTSGDEVAVDSPSARAIGGTGSRGGSSAGHVFQAVGPSTCMGVGIVDTLSR